MAKLVQDMEIDEISLVDRPACQHAAVVIAKRHTTQEDSVAAGTEYFDASGAAVDLATLQPGDVVADGDGNLFEYGTDDAATEGDSVDDQDDQPETAQELGKAATGNRRSAAAFGAGAFRGGLSKSAPARTGASFVDEIRTELSKALTEDDRDAVISKALGRVGELEGQVGEFAEIAKSERNLRRLGEYTEVAKSYGVPVEPDELGLALMHAVDALSEQDCDVIHKALSSAGAAAEALLAENGLTGASNADPFRQIEAYLEDQEGQVAKAAGRAPVSKAAAVTEYFDDNPGDYDAYLRGELS